MAREAMVVNPKSKPSYRTDGWKNLVTGLGTVRDKRIGGQVTAPIILDHSTLDAMYAGDDIVGTIIDLPAQEMVREWITMNVEAETSDPESDTAIAKDTMVALGKLGAQAKFGSALSWARLHGGSVILLGVDDGQDPSEPLDVSRIQTFEWMTVLDRWDVQVEQRYGDPFSPKFGEPELYRVVTSATHTTGLVDTRGQPLSGGMGIVHESRVLRFDGVLTTRRRKIDLGGWCDSVITRLWEVVRDFQAAWGGASHLLSDFSQGIFKMKGLAEMLAADEEDLVLQRMMLLDLARSMVRAIPVDADNESFERTTTPVTGLPDLLDRFAGRLSAAARIPVTLMMGESPSGLNATGDSDIRNFYDRIKSEQERYLREPLSRVIEYLFLAKDGPTNGREPKGWGFVFDPLWQPTEGEQATTRKTVAEADLIYLDTGVVSPEEVAESRYGGDSYSAETSLDPELRGEGAEPEPTDPTGGDPDPTAEPEPKAVDPAQDPEAVPPSSALNGAQVTSMVEVITQVAEGKLPRETGVEILTAAFPFDRDQADAIMGEVGRGFVPEGTAPAGPPTSPVPPTPPPAPATGLEGDDDEEVDGG